MNPTEGLVKCHLPRGRPSGSHLGRCVTYDIANRDAGWLTIHLNLAATLTVFFAEEGEKLQALKPVSPSISPQPEP